MIQFSDVYCINLSSREDRLETFYSQLPAIFLGLGSVPLIKEFNAIWGNKVPPPIWWKSGNGAWGCYRSHLQIIENSINQDRGPILIFEDDAIFCEDFNSKLKAFLEALPEDWDMIYLGGQHLHANTHPPIQASTGTSPQLHTPNPQLYIPYNVNRTHAYAVSKRFLPTLYHHLLRKDWRPGQHIDHHYGRLVQRRENKIYCPPEWLVGQRESYSNISGRDKVEKFWEGSEELDVPYQELPFVCVLGTHSSGSSCMAGVCHHLGVHLGNMFVGYYGTDPERLCGFEAHYLTQICRDTIKFPQTRFDQPLDVAEKKLTSWFNQKKREAYHMDTIAGCKYPILCRMGEQLKRAAGPGLKIVNIDRPIEDSIRSIVKRTCKEHQAKKKKNVEKHMRWLYAGKHQILDSTPEDKQIKIEYYELLSSPEEQIERLIEFLEISPTSHQVQKAIEYVKPTECHVHPTIPTIEESETPHPQPINEQYTEADQIATVGPPLLGP